MYTLSLSKKYGMFFVDCTRFALSPYTETFMSIASAKNEEGCIANTLAATATCALLTFIVPVLPIACAFTFFMSSMALLLVAMTMPFTYPCTLIADAVTGQGATRSDFTFAL